jgi:uncharacterized membrane protein
VVKVSASRSDAVARSRKSLVGFMARHSGGFWRLVHRKFSQRSERAIVLNCVGYAPHRDSCSVGGLRCDRLLPVGQFSEHLRVESMANLLRTVEFLCLGLWLGSDVFLSFVVAPGAFRVLASRDQAGAMVGFALGWMHLIGVICGVVFLAVRFLRTRSFATLVAPATLCVALMIFFTVVSQRAVSPRMAELRGKMGSIEATAEGNPLLVEFQKLHRRSVLLESGVLLAGIAGMFWLVREGG